MHSENYTSDELTHFVGKAKPNDAERYRLFLKVVRFGWLRATYREEPGPARMMSIGGRRRLCSNEAIKCTTLCFCDIPASQFSNHVGKYGPFGIAFIKKNLLSKGAMPVHYVPRDSRNHSDKSRPQTGGERFDDLCTELHHVRCDLEEYITPMEGPVDHLSNLPRTEIPPGHRLLGRLAALQSEFEELVFSGTKFFTAGLAEQHEDDVYMEREWRLREGLAFSMGDIARIILPRGYERQFREDVPEYAGPIEVVSRTAPMRNGRA